ncbi:hypothetical protein EZ313_22225 [Ramlibacter henchirensis]|uniref:Uncharacterized protein n=1 Tax=Ramlibacter henchirensis TaxID=204072 RepID=A0A4Z0BIX9_9BURK|nr:hypothetical protein [Ramlibacter henchirensis]TFY99282.1 hypothetical protein EZ313_22225 [Ramlibacter henchirensis]
MRYERLTPQALALLEAWEQAHRAACDAEGWLTRRSAAGPSTLDEIQQSATELRAHADASFRVLLESKCFGELTQMPSAG